MSGSAKETMVPLPFSGETTVRPYMPGSAKETMVPLPFSGETTVRTYMSGSAKAVKNMCAISVCQNIF